MENRRSSQEIDDAAALWAAKQDRGPLSSEEEAALDAWLDQDVRHFGAYAKARAVVLHSEKARGIGPEFPRGAATTGSPTFSRRRVLWMTGATAAAIGIAAAGGIAVHLAGQRFSTRRGETRVVSLEDGSVVTLNTSSRIIVRFTRNRREVELLEGEALFEVAKDSARPFVVAASDAQVRAVGTSFTVKNLPGKPMQVLVREGVVAIGSRDDETAQLIRVAANNRVVASDASSIAAHPVSQGEVTRELAWRVGRIAFEGETLQQAADAYARYSDIRIVIDNPRIADETVTGLFVSNDPVGFSKAVAMSLNLRVEVTAGEVRLSR